MKGLKMVSGCVLGGWWSGQARGRSTQPARLKKIFYFCKGQATQENFEVTASWKDLVKNNMQLSCEKHLLIR